MAVQGADRWQDAPLLPLGSSSEPTSNEHLTVQVDEPTWSGSGIKTAWWRIEVPEGGRFYYRLDTDQSTAEPGDHNPAWYPDTTLSVWGRDESGDWWLEWADDNSGEDYKARVLEFFNPGIWWVAVGHYDEPDPPVANYVLRFARPRTSDWIERPELAYEQAHNMTGFITRGGQAHGDAQSAAFAAHAEDASPAPSRPTTGSAISDGWHLYSDRDPGAEGLFDARYGQSIDARGVAVSRLQGPPSPWPDAPDDAFGWEYEPGGVWVPTAARLDYVFTEPALQDDVAAWDVEFRVLPDPDAHVTVDDQFTVTPRPDTTSLNMTSVHVETATYGDGWVVGGSLDVTAYMGEPDNGHAVLALDRANLYSVSAAWGSDYSFGGQFSKDVVYALRPARHRWVYDEVPAATLPPLRQFPRDDNLATSSAERIWPVSSEQGSLRRLGYY